MNGYLDEKRDIPGNLYSVSYIILILSALLRFHSEFTTSVTSTSTLISFIWYLGLGSFLFMQVILLLSNGLDVQKYFIPLLIFIMGGLTLLGIQIINLRTFIFLILLINSKFINFKKFAKIDLYTRLVGLLFMFGLYIFDIFPIKYRLYSIDVRGNGLIRRTWGFNNANTLGEYYLYLLISIIILINVYNPIHKLSINMKMFYSALIFLSGYYIEFLVTDSRSAQISLIIIFIGWILCMVRNVHCIKPRYGGYVFVLMVLISIVLDYQIMLSGSQFSYINHLLSNRLVLQNGALMLYGIHLFGNPAFQLGNPFWVDNQYIYNFIEIGILGSFVFGLIIWNVFKKCYKNDDFILYVIIIAIIIKGFFEQTILDYIAVFPIIFSFIENKEKYI